MIRRVHIIGRKNSGKTTLMAELVTHLTSQGRRVGAIKHTHHHHELDTPGKDSHRHRQAGAAVVGILSRQMSAVFQPVDENDRAADRYERMLAAFGGCDLVLVEGDSQTDAPKIEVWRAVSQAPPLAADDPSITAIVTDDDGHGLPIDALPRSDVAGLAAWILATYFA
ncbi:MAG: molybdopterin-guanine dinucleotide biosynthesis protein B [Planctomycetales bacterium]|nr:molybdopterin-guanine dinucleotide biosynthesis protein B [Planctomycetales bacterium]